MKLKKKICCICKKEEYLYAKKMCLTCYKKQFPEKFSIKRTEIKQKTPTKRIRPTSKAQEERLKKYRILRDEYLEQHKACERCNKTNTLLDLHHKESRIGERLFRAFCALCRNCHQWVHEHPKEAKEQGFLL